MSVRLYYFCYGPIVKRVLVTKAGLIGAGGYNRRSRTIGRGLSKSHSLGLECIGSLVRRNVNVPVSITY